MSTRPLRQYLSDYPTVEVAVDPEDVIAPWRRHRQRFVERLAGLSEEQWSAATRCDAWDVTDVVGHLISTDLFWMASLGAAQAGSPSTFLVDFDPSTSPEAYVAPMRGTDPEVIRSQFEDGTTAFLAAVDGLEAPAWESRGESPMGHMPVPLVLAHALWDSWLHERDIFEPLGLGVPVETDELMVATWYTLVAGALQGGLIGDEEPVGPGLSEPVEASLGFDDLPEPIGIAVGTGVRVVLGGSAAPSVGSAVHFVERGTGRLSGGVPDSLPPDLAAHLERAFEIL